MIVNIVAGKSVEKSPPLFTVSGGTYTYQQSVDSNGIVNWELALLSGTNATLTFQKVVPTIDVFICGGGEPGKSVSDGSGGGKGGNSKSYYNVAISAGTAYPFTVGGSGGSTSIFKVTCSSGGGAAGGKGANFSAWITPTAGGNGVYAFGSSTSLIYSGRRYGAGGGGGTSVIGNFNPTGGTGGATGGGHGGDGTYNTQAETSGAANTGSGGGGQGTKQTGGNTWEYYPAGNGGSGIIIIRNHRA